MFPLLEKKKKSSNEIVRLLDNLARIFAPEKLMKKKKI